MYKHISPLRHVRNGVFNADMYRLDRPVCAGAQAAPLAARRQVQVQAGYLGSPTNLVRIDTWFTIHDASPSSTPNAATRQSGASAPDGSLLGRQTLLVLLGVLMPSMRGPEERGS